MPGVDAGRAVAAGKGAGILAFVFLSSQRYADFGDRIEELIRSYDGYLGALAFGLLWVVCLAGTLAAGFLARFWMRVVFALPLLAGALVGMVYEAIAGAAVNYDNASIMREEILLAGSALSFFASPARVAVLLTLLGGVALLTPPPRPPRRPDCAPDAKPSRRRCGPGFLVAVAAAPFVAVPALIVARGGYGTSGLPVPHTVPSLFAMVELDERLSAAVRREPVRLPLDGAAAPPPHVVLVIDESIRGDWLDLNVERGATPSLQRHRNRVVNFGHAVAAANCSATTNVILRTGAMPSALREDAYTNPWVWDYARRAGMRTVYVEAQTSRPNLRNRLSLRELERIDEFVYQDGETGRDRDLAAVDSIGDFVQRPQPHFIFLVKSGVHFPYDDPDPTERGALSPTIQPERAITARNRLKNSYGNAIARNVDPFFEKLLSEVGFDGTVLLYTSDHGQNLLDDGRIMTHCSTDEPGYFEGLVPMLAITQHPRWAAELERAAVRNLNRTSHFNLFATLLVLFGYDRTGVAGRYEPSLFDEIGTAYGFVAKIVTPVPRLLFGRRTELPMHPIPRRILERGASQSPRPAGTRPG